jgi:hypothetical protein
MVGGADSMNMQNMTLNEVRKRGMDALSRELGAVGMLKFMHQFEQGQGDYSTERHPSVDKLRLEKIVADIKRDRKGV